MTWHVRSNDRVRHRSVTRSAFVTALAAVLLYACSDVQLEDDPQELQELSARLLEDGGTGDASPPAPDGGEIDPTPEADSGAPGGAISGPLGGLGGGPGAGGSSLPPAFAHWQFEDCGSSSTQVQDSSPSQAHATRSGLVACAGGVPAGTAVLFEQKKDVVSAPSNPAFDAKERLTLAAWVNPTRVSEGTLISKTSNGVSVFALVLQNKNVLFRVNVDNGRHVRQVISKAPIQANRWTHITAQFDGRFVRLFKDGALVGQNAASGLIADARAPIQIGNNEQRNDVLRGRIDEVWLSSAAVSATDVARLSCGRGTPSIAVSPTASGPREAGDSFTYTVTLTNHDFGGCQPRDAFANAFLAPGIVANTVPAQITLLPGASGQLGVQVSHDTDAVPGTVPFEVNATVIGREQSGGEGPPIGPVDRVSASAEYTVKEPTGCFVRTSRELLIRALSVVEDPMRTTFDGPEEDPRTGAWTFGHLMEQLAPTDAEAPAMVQRMFETWLSDQSINGFTVAAKPRMKSLVLDSWPRSPDGQLDLQRSPLRLLAIVNRIDSRNLAQGHAGEGRFVFGVLGPDGNAEEFTVIFEYRLPATTPAQVQDWADRWHALGALPFPSEEYNSALQAITDGFTRRGAEPGRPNGSALAQFRTNEVALTNAFVWELREFELSAATHRLEPATVKLTPDNRFITGSPLVADFINQNESAVLSEKHDVPPSFGSQAFLGGSSFNDLNTPWTAPGILSNDARHKFSLNTCNGCHSLVEAATGFLHVNRRNAGQEAALSPFMQGVVLPDPVTRESRTLNDLKRRNDDLTALVCPSAGPTSRAATQEAASPTLVSASREAFLSKGIERTH